MEQTMQVIADPKTSHFTDLQSMGDFVADRDKRFLMAECNLGSDVEFFEDGIAIKGISQDKPLRCTETGFNQISQRLGFPARLRKRLHPATCTKALNELTESIEDDVARVIVDQNNDGNDIVAVHGPRYTFFSDSHIVEEASRLADKIGTEKITASSGPHITLIDIWDEKQVDRGAQVGDFFNFGIGLVNSYSGMYRHSQLAKASRLVCTNGLTIPEKIAGFGIKKRHTKGLPNAFDQMRLFDEIDFDNVIEKLNVLATTLIADEIGLCRRLLNETAKVFGTKLQKEEMPWWKPNTDDERQSQAAVRNSQGNLYGLQNWKTSKVQNLQYSTTDGYEIERAAGSMLSWRLN